MRTAAGLRRAAGVIQRAGLKELNLLISNQQQCTLTGFTVRNLLHSFSSFQQQKMTSWYLSALRAMPCCKCSTLTHSCSHHELASRIDLPAGWHMSAWSMMHCQRQLTYGVLKSLNMSLLLQLDAIITAGVGRRLTAAIAINGGVQWPTPSILLAVWLSMLGLLHWRRLRLPGLNLGHHGMSLLRDDQVCW